jgi:hypothetical protein
VYPSLKLNDVRVWLAVLILYLLLSLPLLFYIKTRYKPRPRPAVLIVALLILLGATILQYFLSHPTLQSLFVHLVFYLFAGMIEETLWRGKLWQLVSHKSSSQLLTLVIVTLHFAVLHMPFAFIEKPVPLFFIAQVFGLGILLGVLRIISKKVTIPAFVHAVVNMAVYT